MEKKPYGTVLIKASKIIDVILSSNRSLSLQEISDETELTPSTTLKILDTLVLIGYVSKDNHDRRFSIGGKLVELSNLYVNSLDIVKISAQPLNDLLSSVNETVHLGILQNNEIMYMKKLEPSNQSIYMTSKVGITRPLYSSAMGKAVLSEFPKKAFMQYLDTTKLTPYTSHTITHSQDLTNEINKIHKTKIAFDDEEMELECFCIGTSLMDKTKILGAFSVSMPKYRLTEDKKNEIITSVLSCKQIIEASFA